MDVEKLSAIEPLEDPAAGASTTFVQSIRRCLVRYASFRGRADRSEFWHFAALYWVVVLGMLVCANVLEYRRNPSSALTLVAMLLSVVWLGLVLPFFSVLVRRLHDSDTSGFYYFITLIPLVGAFALLARLMGAGTDGTNRYGVRDQF